MDRLKLIKLIREVFGSETGMMLLKELEADVGRPMFSPSENNEPSTNRVMWRTGQYDLVQTIRSFVDMPQSEIDELDSTVNKIFNNDDSTD